MNECKEEAEKWQKEYTSEAWMKRRQRHIQFFSCFPLKWLFMFIVFVVASSCVYVTEYSNNEREKNARKKG